MTFTKAQQLMIDDGLPLSFIMSQEERDKAWQAKPPRTAGQYGKFNTEPTSYGATMTKEEITLLFELKASKERGAASLSCSQHLAAVAQLIKLGFARHHGFSDMQFFITDAGMAETKKHKRPESVGLVGTAKHGPVNPIIAEPAGKLIKEHFEKPPRPPGSGKGKAEEVVAMMRKPGGVTKKEVLKAIGWKAISFQQQAAQCGVTVEIDKSCDPWRYIVK